MADPLAGCVGSQCKRACLSTRLETLAEGDQHWSTFRCCVVEYGAWTSLGNTIGATAACFLLGGVTGLYTLIRAAAARAGHRERVSA